MSPITVSIIIPTLNEEIALPHLLDDLLHQDSAFFEVIVVDGGSSDNTQHIVQGYHPQHERIRLLVADKPGVGAQRNLAAATASGNYLLFLDADDRLPQTFLTQLQRHLQNTVPSVFTNYCVADTTRILDRCYVWTLNHCLHVAKWLKTPYALGACLGCATHVFQQIEGFDPSITYMEDTDFVRRCMFQEYPLHIFRSPRFMLSLRRFRKEGLIRQYILILPSILKLVRGQKITTPLSVYRMDGGAAFEKTSTPKHRKP